MLLPMKHLWTSYEENFKEQTLRSTELQFAEELADCIYCINKNHLELYIPEACLCILSHWIKN